MIFNSLTFLFFFLFSIISYHLIANKYKSRLVLFFSVIFYLFWDYRFLSLILFTTGVDYFVAQILGNKKLDKRFKTFSFYFGVFINLSVLLFFKYFLFFIENLNLLFYHLNFTQYHVNFTILLPFGVSFYTFEAISYLIDVRRGAIKSEKNIWTYFGFIFFFPKLFAGPIQRAGDLIPQLTNLKPLNWFNFKTGIRHILIGLFLKVVLADQIGSFVDSIFILSPNSFSALDTLTASFLFGFQIYYDFSAYSYIAIGAAKIFGVSIPTNFNYPYLAGSFKDFWKRWHISLSGWIRDYLYLPLIGQKVMLSNGQTGIGNILSSDKSISVKKNYALIVTWAIMGLWHGAGWNFLFWGVYHAFFILFERLMSRFRWYKNAQSRGFLTPFTLLIVMLSWIPFRTKSLSDTMIILRKLFNFKNYVFLTFQENTYIVAALVLISFYLVYFIKKRFLNLILNNIILSFVSKLVFYVFLITLIFIYFKTEGNFIYFQF
jgi:alginate O-acetyltransferase complex protein AlgI